VPAPASTAIVGAPDFRILRDAMVIKIGGPSVPAGLIEHEGRTVQKTKRFQ
jgi:hypothetical protein